LKKSFWNIAATLKELKHEWQKKRDIGEEKKKERRIYIKKPPFLAASPDRLLILA